jgi:site-specific recombinase XerD
MIKLRAKKLKKNYSLYLDYNCTHPVMKEKGVVKQVRKVEFLKLYVEHDYNIRKKIEPYDRETWETARAILKKRELSLLTNDQELLPKSDSANFIDFFESVLQQKKNHRTYTATLKHLIDFAGRKLTFRQVNKEFITSFQSYIYQKVHQNSVIHYIKRLRIVWNLAIKREIIQNNPFLAIDNLKKVEPTRTYLTIDELQQLASHSEKVNPIIVKAFLFSCFTGLRFSDIQQLKWQAIKDNQIHYCQVKTSKAEILPLSKQALSILETFEKKEGLVFIDLPSNQSINPTLKVWAKHAEISKNLHFHVARHTFATLSLTSGVDLYTVSKLIGHANITQTQIYAQIIDAQKTEAVNKLPEIKLHNKLNKNSNK